MLLLAAIGAAATAQDQPAAGGDPQAGGEEDLRRGRLIRVRLPLTGNADAHVKSMIQRTVDQLTAGGPRGDQRPILVLELATARRGEGYGLGNDFERAVSLARFLASDRRLAAVKTVAYIPRSIRGHGVLVAMACEEIAMDPEAEFGDAGADEQEGRPVEPGVVSLYQQIATARRTLPEAIALGMLDERLEVVKVETEDATEFVLAEEVDDLKETKTVISEETLVTAGSLGRFTGREGREYGFVKYLADDRDALARVLRVPNEAVIEDQSLAGDWRPVILDINGPITFRKVRQLETLIGAEIKQQDVNWIGFRIDSSGGRLEDCIRLATIIAELDPTEVRTVAYIPVEAAEGAALVALACDQIVMQPSAHLGGQGTVAADREVLDPATTSIRESLAEAAERSWSLLVAMIDPEIEVFRYNNTQTGEIRYLSRAEANELPNSDDWSKGPAITSPNETLRLTSKQAKDFDIAWQLVDNYEEFKQLYGFEKDPPVAEPNWALELVEALSSPALTVMLLVIGFVGIYIELHTPGMGVGGFVAAVAFLLFFWSKFLDGTADWLEILLFVGGVFFIVMEILVLPGFGVFGLGGATMIIAALVLASQTFVLPRTESQLVELRDSLAVVAAAGVCIFATAMVLRRYLPQAPFLRTLLLSPPPAHERAELDHRETVADYAHLVGERGTAATPLMPAGKATIAGKLIDVIADGDIIERGQTIEVTSARGNRVLVRAVQA